MSYIITDKTLAIIPFEGKAQILEINDTKVIKDNVINIISYNCRLNGSTLEGRQKACSYLIGIFYKPPIILDEIKNIILIPTHSSKNKDCAWIILNNIIKYYALDNKAQIVFKNHKTYKLNVSYNQFDRQVMRATRLESFLRGRNNQKYL